MKKTFGFHAAKCYTLLNIMDFYYLILVILVINSNGMSCAILDGNLTAHNDNNRTIEDVSILGKGLTVIPDGSIHVKNLNVAYNHLSELSDFVFFNKSYKVLSKIDLHENKISNVSSTAFKGLRKLKNLDFSYNKVSSLDPYVFKHNPRLEKLDLSSNQIRFGKLKVFLMSSSLESLILTNNKIDQLYELTLVGLPNLMTLILDQNLLLTISENAFKPLTDIQYLSISNTGVTYLGKGMFRKLPKVINLEGTPLANNFSPALKRIRNGTISRLLAMSEYFVQ